MKRAFERVLFALIGLLVVLVIANSVLLVSSGSKVGTRISEIEELSRPAEVELLTIASVCSDCYNLSGLTSGLKEALRVANEKRLARGSVEAKEIIKKYQIKKLPAVIIKGEVGKISVSSFKNIDDALVFQGVGAPYEDALNGAVVGKVSAIVIGDKSCKECFDYSNAVDSLKAGGVYFKNVEKIDFSNMKANELISEHSIKKIPAVILSSDLEAYPAVLQNLIQAGIKRADDSYILESNVPYVDTETGKVRGLVELTLLSDKECKDCYDVNIHKQIFQRMGLAVSGEKTFDVSSSEGKAIVEKYSIMSVPTSIITGDVDAYEFFKQIWVQAGSIEDDGAYVFRHLSVLGPGIKYKDLKTGKVVENKQPELPSQQGPAESIEENP